MIHALKRPLLALLIIVTSAYGATALAQCLPSTPGRFKLEGALAYDTQTNLTWMRCSVGVTWSETQGCSGSSPKLMNTGDAQLAATRAGQGWRVPELEELHSLIEPECTDPALDSLVFPGVGDLGDGIPYWSTSQAEMPILMNYYVDFSNGSVDAHTLGFPLAVRLVRDGKPK